MNPDRAAQESPPIAGETGIQEIDSLTHDECRAILAEIFRFMYQNEDGTWDRDKEVSGTEMVSLLCADMPELRPRPITQEQERKEQGDPNHDQDPTPQPCPCCL